MNRLLPPKTPRFNTRSQINFLPFLVFLLLSSLFLIVLPCFDMNLLPHASLRVGATSQQPDDGATLWQDVDEKSIPNAGLRPIIPRVYRTLQLNREGLKQLLRGVPLEQPGAPRGAGFQLALPMPEGNLAHFLIVESPIMEPGLAQQFPDIKTYRGQGIDDPSATTRFILTPQGFHALILSSGGTLLIDPYSKGGADYYMSYEKKNLDPGDGFECFTGSAKEQIKSSVSAISSEMTPQNFISIGDSLRHYRIAVAATGEYTDYQCRTAVDGCSQGAKTAAFNAITTTINDVNAIYERELAVHLDLVTNELNIIFTDAVGDGYSDGDPQTMNQENEAKLDAIIINSNYDIGHVLGAAGGGGYARIGVVCKSDQDFNSTYFKAYGASSISIPSGSIFDTEFVAHEIGHQFGAGHTFNGQSSQCSGRRAATSAREPGAGSTIMAYVHKCDPQNLQGTVDNYFNTGSIEEMLTHINANGNCYTSFPTTNNPPTVDAGLDYTIPMATPFTLTATGSDPNGDQVYYCWEEFDLGPASPPDTDADGQARPIFRSRPPVTSPSRTFPSLSSVLDFANIPPTLLLNGDGFYYMPAEALPLMSRSMNFRVTARDYRAAGGGVSTDDMHLNVTSSAGPFYITQPNTAMAWAPGSHDVFWNVANTSAFPVNCATVKISLSTDGGATFPPNLVLAPSTANNGMATVTIPNVVSTQARIKVEAVNDIFFDISDTNFIIPASTCSYSLSQTSSGLIPYTGATALKFTVLGSSSCGWQAKSNASWITVTTASGNGGDKVKYDVLVNVNGAVRTGTISVAGQMFTVTQASNGTCSYSISPSSQTFGSAGGPGTINITTPGGTCNWLASANVSWIVITGGSGGQGSASALYTVTPNTSGGQRTGTLNVAGFTFTVTQTSTEDPKINPVSATASGTYGGETPGSAIDGNINTDWNSGGYAPQWIEIDLGQTYAVSKIKLNATQDITGNTSQQIYMGAQPQPTTLVYTFNQISQNHQWLEHTFSPAITSVRYVRVLTTSSPTWIAWFEIELYGVPSSSETKINPVSATASGTYGGETPGSAIDGNINTDWNSGGYAPQWIEIDLGQTYAVSRIKLNATQDITGNTSQQIYMGSQPQPTTLVYTFNQVSQDHQWLEHPFSPSITSVRYVRVLTTLSPTWIAWFEIEVYGVPSSSETKINAVSATASGTYSIFTPGLAIDGNINTDWNSGGYAPQWIEIDLGQNYSVSRIRLNATQDITGNTSQQIYMGLTPQPTTLAYTFNQVSQEHQWLEHAFSPVITNVRYVRVLTTSSPTWIAWYEIEVYKP